MDFEREIEQADEASTFVLKTKCEDRRRRHKRGRRK